MKKVLMLSTLIVCMVLLAVTCTGVVFGMPNTYDGADEIFRNVLDQLLAEEGFDNIEVTAEKQLIYDINLSGLGYVYDFEINENDCYAIVINNNGVYEAVEVYFDSKNPYAGLIETPVYVSNMIYLYWAEDKFYSIGSEIALSDTVIDELSRIAHYCGSGDLTVTTETVNFVSKNENAYDLAKRNPSNVEITDLPNACVPIAGANIVQYFDRTCQNLVPNFTPGSAIGDFYLYKTNAEEMKSVTRQLYSDMGTNTTGTGASVSQFKSGMEKYSKRYGYNIEFSSCMTSNQLKYDKVKTEINNGKPVAIFSRSVSIATFITSEGKDTIQFLNSLNPHSLIAFGYKEINYTLNNNTIRQDKYMSVSTGLAQISKGYMKVTNERIFENALSVRIF